MSLVFAKNPHFWSSPNLMLTINDSSLREKNVTYASLKTVNIAYRPKKLGCVEEMGNCELDSM